MKSKQPAKKQQPKPAQPRIGNHLKPQFAVFFGKTGSGKSYALWEKYTEWQKVDRLQTLVFSPKEILDNYAGKLRCKSYTDMHQLVKDARAGKDVVFASSRQREDDERKFDLFCRLAFALSYSGRPCNVIADELHTVDRPTGSVPGWHNISDLGRGFGMRVLASTPRPTHVNKDFFTSLTYAWCGNQLYEDDAKTTAKLVLCRPDEIMALNSDLHEFRDRSM